MSAAGASAPAAVRGARLAQLSPSYFGMVMATGIVSLAAARMGFFGLAWAIFLLNVAVYALLWGLNALRTFRYPRRYLADLISHKTAPGFFTFVAATGVLGAQVIVLTGWRAVALGLWFVALALWFALTYTIFTAFTVKKAKPPLVRGLSGAWLLSVVATQSIAVLAAMLAAGVVGPYRIELNFFALSMWLWGGMLYIWVMTLIFYRYMFFRLSPADLSPPYWINMGAMAISTLVGSLLIANAGDAPFLASILPFLKGFTVFYWASGTWWIPMLVILAVWRHGYRRFPLTYDPLYWGAVFPLGMYSVATSEMVEGFGFAFLEWLPQTFFWVALAAWAAAFIALLRNLNAVRRAGRAA